jgi:hypothetical protein
VGRYRDTNRSDTVCYVCSQGREVGTAVTGFSGLNMTGNAVTYKEMQQQRTTPSLLVSKRYSRLSVGKCTASSENKT